ncbi:FIG038982: hypothetical protein [hydrothermal vent metagenome]|uniref:DUF1648 domain-containing protein n=1 Tax=hydrothermal vent metagenome TaxID=652676 RepID=A0A3B0RG10_9ZZZZ
MIGKGILINGLLTASMFGVSLWAMNLLAVDGQFASHFGWNGQADGFSSRAGILWMLPFLALGLNLLFTVLPRLDPRRKNLLRSATPYLIAWVGTGLILLFVHSMLVLNAAGMIDIETASSGQDMIRWLALFMGGFFAVLGSVLGKVRPNWFLGVRTPWTLSSDLSWDKTHRVTGYLFMATGVFTVLIAVSPLSRWALAILVAGTSIAAFWAIVYSWLVWKTDPARETLVPDEAE